MDLSLQQTIENVEKTLQTPAYIAGPILVRENLSPFVNRLTEKQTNVRDRLVRKTGSGLAASWNVLTAMGTGDAPFAEGSTPTEDASTYQRRSAIYKELGKTKSITDRMLAAGKTFLDQEVEQTEVAMRETIQDEEYFLFNGNSGTSVLQFDGLKTIIQTNIVNDANNALGFRTDLLDAAIANLVTNFGVMPTAIYCSYNMKRAINQSLVGDVRVNLDQTNQVATGVDVGFYQSMIGKLPIIPTFGIVDDSTTYAGNIVSDIYLVTEKWKGQDAIYLEDLYPLSKSMLARTGAAIKFMVTECTVLVCRAEEFQTRITGVRVQ